MDTTPRSAFTMAVGLLLALSGGVVGVAALEAEQGETQARRATIRVENASQDRSAYLGVSLVHLESVEGAEDGLYITKVFPGTGAAEAGLREHDRIFSVDGKGVVSHRDVRRATAGREPGDVVQVAVLREGEEMVFDVTLGGPPSDGGAHGHKGPHHVVEIQQGDRPMIGVQAITLTDQLAAFHEVPGGVLVTEVVEDSPAWRGGIRAGDVVVRWNGEKILGMQDIHSRLGRSRPGDVAEVELIRRGSVQQHSVTLATQEEVREIQVNIRLSEEDPEE